MAAEFDEILKKALDSMDKAIMWKIPNTVEGVNPDAILASRAMAAAYAASRYSDSLNPGRFTAATQQNELALKYALKSSRISVPEKAFEEFNKELTEMLPKQKARA